MKIKVLGAAGGQVTGSCYLVSTSQARILVDCGMFQGSREAEDLNRALPVEGIAQLDAIVVTHAHLDHTGRLPVLVKHGYTGPIFLTPATKELMMIILEDSARIQLSDNERTNRKRQRAGEDPIEPLYEPDHVEPVRNLAREVTLHEFVEVAPGIRARYFEAGHMLGSTSIELEITDAGVTKSVVFSGDLGPANRPMLRDFESMCCADLVIMESTYGDHNHQPYDKTVAEFEAIVKKVAEARGKILVPTFAVGRSQQIIYHLAVMFHERKVETFPIFLDSPMAIKATEVYREHPELFDDEMQAHRDAGLFPISGGFFKPTITADESKALNHVGGPCAILAGAGMCNAGRILHHLKQNLWKPDTHVLIVGYQGNGTLGRRLVNGEPHVKIHGEKIAVRAQVHTMGGFSAHADQADLLRWFATLASDQPRLVLTHGEDIARETLRGIVNQKFGIEATLPALGEEIDL
ncbi:MBL fold metallo-hydrolase [Synoicihabitans lomoniglobus]|uniref:MBL fold metallo-hydrolase n=1 Tax=Synoicihabitans lomoniglobus TaxID=2909285 RepID=A0AAF0CMT5_9BACT|nr:MBL fold metallo-hydrolase [Opitutaceae bacterium LMO-M01]WED63756.1 MBL fold metallo-hydrolase [Opitutaceae bacterium LMO-M01]